MDAETAAYIENIVDRRLIVAFDLFGTLLSTDSIVGKIAEHYGDKAESISAAWRKYQLEYTWRLNSMSVYEPFDIVTQRSLIHAISEATAGTPPPTASDPAIVSILAAYATLSPYPDVKAALSPIARIKHLQPIIFTNGTPTQVDAALRSAPAVLAPFGTSRERSMLCADEIGKYKPHPMIYQFLAAKMGKSIAVGERHGGIDEVVLVSANAFDVVGAQAVGVTAVWVDRAGAGWCDALVEGPPQFTVTGLEELGGVLETILAEKAKVWDEASGRDI
ncbi:hypothetical protein DRE_05448 [Drechslerella stenobrocha 248]|uniref:Haloacid dehalogenase n=1 Tax=Drechslerella stenobrocha 248 TaxID=1043628 RepID=W7I985_9PEZI|nr:hypothetical protein DRE_05448 [Drechslerella stenobrocha 248]